MNLIKFIFHFLLFKSILSCRRTEEGTEEECPENCFNGTCDSDCKCLSCITGFHGDYCETPCSSLDTNCLECTQNGECTKCNSTYYLKNYTCHICNEQCLNKSCEDETGYCS